MILVHVHVLYCASWIREKKKFQSPVLWNSRLSYTAEYINPWLTFNSCPITAIENILSLRTMTLASFSFSQLVYAVENPNRSASVTFVQPILNTPIHLHKVSEEQHCPHPKHINVCAFQHLAHPLPIKYVPQISVLLWYKPEVAEPCSLLNRISHDRKVETTTVLTSQPVKELPAPKGLPHTSNLGKKCRNLFRIQYTKSGTSPPTPNVQ